MGYPMNYGRVIGRNYLSGDYDPQQRTGTGLIRGDLRRMEADQRDEAHLAAYAKRAGITSEQARQVLDDFLGTQDVTWTSIPALALASETACSLSYDPSCRHHASAAQSAGVRRSFSDFIRNANPEEKGEVYEDVMKRAIALQKAPDDLWRAAALRLGEQLADTGPENYYAMTPTQWLDWCENSLPSATVAFTPTPTAYFYLCPKCEREVQWEGPDAEISGLSKLKHSVCGTPVEIVRRSPDSRRPTDV